MADTKNTILHGRIFPPLIRFAIPLMLAILLQALYGAVDLFVVGKFGDTASVSAVSNGSQIMHTITGIITGLTMGVTVLVGHAVGAKDNDRAARTVGGAIRLFALVTVVITTMMVIFTKEIAVFMNVPAEAMDKTVEYVRICSAGTVFIVGFNAISGLFRGLGNSKSPLLFIGIACAVNIAADLLLVGYFKLDAAGAAYATIFAQAVSVVFSIFKIRHDKLPFPFCKEHIARPEGAQLRILATGGPLALQDCLVSTSFLIILAIINEFGLVASASLGIAEKLFLFLAIVPMSFMSALSAFVAQNVGAHQERRALDAMKIAMAISFVFGLAVAALSVLKGNMLASIFEDDPLVIATAAEYLRSSGLEYAVIAITFCFLGYFNGIGKTTFVMIEGLISSFVFRIPLSYFLSRLPDTNLYIIGFAVPLSALSRLILCIAYFFFVRSRRLRTGGSDTPLPSE